jgi:hypothetical protein
MMTNKITKLCRVCLVTLVVISTDVLAFADDEIGCPSRLTVQQSVDQDVSGWQKNDSHKSHLFMNVSFSEDSPDKKIILAPTREKTVRHTLIKEWELPKSTKGYWVSCHYDDAKATVAKKLPDDVSYCKAEYDRNSSRTFVKRWQCVSEEKLKQEAKSKKRKTKNKRKTN